MDETIFRMIDELTERLEKSEKKIAQLEADLSNSIHGAHRIAPLTEKQVRIFNEALECKKAKLKLSVRKTAEKLNMSTSLVSYTIRQLVRRGFLKEIKNNYFE